MAQVTLEATASPARALRATARGGILNLAGAVAAGAGGVAITWLVAAGLSPAAAGQFFAATSAFLLAQAIAKLGTPTGLVYFVARARNEGQLGGLRSVLWAALAPSLLVSCLVSAVTLIGADLLAGFRDHPSQTYVDMLRALAVFLPPAVALEALLAATRGFGRMRPTVVVDKLARTLAQLVLLAVVVWWRAGPLEVTLAWALPYLPAAIAAAGSLRRHCRARATDAPPTWDVTPRRFWAYTAPRAMAGVAQLALQRLDIVLVAALLGFAPAAAYTVATRFVSAGQLLSQAIGSAVQPRLAKSMSGGDHDTARTLYQATTAWIVLTTWPLYLIIGIAASWYLRIFGGHYVTDESVAVVAVLALGMLIATGCGVVDSVLVMAGRTGWQLYNVAAAAVVNVGLDLWLIPRIGILGAAIGWTAAIAVNNLIPLLQLSTVFRLHPIGRSTLLSMTLATVFCGLIPAAGLPFGDIALGVGIGIGAVGYLASAWRARKSLLSPANT